MVVAEKPDQEPLDELLLPDDDPLDLGAYPVEGRLLLLDFGAYLLDVYGHRSNLSFVSQDLSQITIY